MLVHVSTNEGKPCPFQDCPESIGRDRFEEGCNHLLNVHNLNCLHVGQETSIDSNGNPRQNTVAVFGD